MTFKSASKSSPGYILGKIVFIETRTASNADSHSGIGPEGSPLRLLDGTVYHLLEVEQVSFGSSSKVLYVACRHDIIHNFMVIAYVL